MEGRSCTRLVLLRCRRDRHCSREVEVEVRVDGGCFGWAEECDAGFEFGEEEGRGCACGHGREDEDGLAT